MKVAGRFGAGGRLSTGGRSRSAGRSARLTTIGVAGLLLGGLLVATPDRAVAEPEQPSLQVDKVNPHGVRVSGKPWPYTPQKHVPAPAPKWPAPVTARVTLPAQGSRSDPAKAGSLPVLVEPSTGRTGADITAVTVQLLDKATTPNGWRNGLILRVGTPQDAPRSGTVRVAVDYDDFRYAYGGDWASRLRLWQIPPCALQDQAASTCAAIPLHSVNDTTTGTVTAEVPVTPVGGPGTPTTEAQIIGDEPTPMPGGTLVALTASASGPGGDFGATPMLPSATWSSGGSTGDFSWSYPMRMPPSVGGSAPSVGLSYSSSSVDGRSEVTNNQPSWIGEGFEYWPGYIERQYVPCSEDMTGTHNNTNETPDLCWRSDNATMSLNGRGSELIFETGKGWHARNEDGSRIEKLTGASNGDNNGEHWKVTGADGTQYFFGLHSLPGQTSTTNSAWTVPVAGNHTGEPCRQTTFVDSFCAQVWRWNLDYVVDVRGNTISYWYTPETNKYARNVTDTDEVSYTRGGVLDRIDYGTWDRGSSDRSVTALAQVIFATGNRCVTSSCGTHNATNWPDTPWDQECTGTSCPGNYAPTFWSTKRLAKITTRVWDTTKTTPAWQEVDSWTLTHSFPPPGDGSLHAGLWLEKIEHAGLVGTPVTLPPTTFTPTSMPNRVLTDTLTTSNWQRIDYITTDTGLKIDIEYSLPECTENNLPSAAHTNDKRCYPVKVIDPNDPQGENLILEWWHKYRVEAISESDVQLSGGHQAPPKFTYYQYVGAPAWHYADDDGLTKPDRKTWNQFRGYATVRTRVGDVPGAQTLTETRYLRGMHGDRLNPTGGTRTVTVPASIGSETVYDEDQFAGMVREQVVYNGTDTKPVSKTVYVPWRSSETASRTINGDTVTARFTDTKITYSATALGVDADRGWRTARAESWFSDTYGTLDQAQQDGDLAHTGDEKCTTHIYNRNLTANLIKTVKQTTTTALTCGTAPSSTDHIISDTRHYYDGATSPDTAPTYGSVTKVEQLKDWSQAGGTVWQPAGQSTFDAFGRPDSVTDAKGNVVTTTYTPASGGPVTKVTTTRGAPYNWVTSADMNPYWGSTTKTTDQNLKTAEVAYDALGRVWRTWSAVWGRTNHESTPSAEYTYTLAPNRDAYPYTTARTLHEGGEYRTTYHIFDSLLRPRQTQTASFKTGGTIVTDTVYDKLGRAEYTYKPYLKASTPSGTLWWVPQWSVRAMTKTVYDNANRSTAQILLAGDGISVVQEKWRTTTAYEGDLTRVTPPAGATATTTLNDIQGRTTDLRQHTTTQGVTGPYQSTHYTYNSKDQLVKVADHVGNEWTYTFDVKGRQIQLTDPDKGATTNQYNDFNELVKTTDARGEALWYVYDALGRKTELRDDSATGALRAQWKYDRYANGLSSGAKGQLTEAYRYEPPGSTNIYKRQIGGFTADYQPTTVTYNIPAVEGTGITGQYGVGYSYSPYTGVPDGMVFGSAGGLTSETVDTVFGQTTGLPIRLTTTVGGTYVTNQIYTDYGELNVSIRDTDTNGYVNEEFSYDEVTRRIKQVVVDSESSPGPISDRTYTYGHSGDITSITESPQGSVADTQCFRQDALRRLTSAWTPKAGVDCAAAPTVANLGGPAPYWLDWTFDAVGNRTQEVSHATGGDTTRDYTVPTGGPGVVRPHAVTQVTTTAPGQSPVVTRYGYDATGNTTCRPTGAAANTCPPGTNSQNLSWNAEGSLDTISGDAPSAGSNIYDADGNRLIRRDATGTTLYLPGQEIRRDNSSIVTATRYYSFNGTLIASRTPSGLNWLFTDHQGTQHTSVDVPTQAVTNRRQTPFGNPRGFQPVWANPKGFVGGDIDPTGLTHLGAREYDPGLGRFISVDPIQDLTDPQQWHGYSYANNSPVSMSDPSGLIPADCLDFVDCYGYDPSYDGGCPYGCGTDENQEWGESQGKTSSKPNTSNDTRILGHIIRVPDDVDIVEFTRRWYAKVGAKIEPYFSHELLLLDERILAMEICDDMGRPGSCQQWVEQLYEGYIDFLSVNLADLESPLGGPAAPLGPIRAKSGTGSRSSGGGACSFSGDTGVLMADGTTKPISEVRVGDLVLAVDPETGERGPRKVTNIWIHQDALKTLDVEGGALTTTEDHPFWNVTHRSWDRADELDRGDRLLTPSGVTVEVQGTLTDPAHVGRAYNLTVHGIHTYYVLAGENSVLVHNSNGCRTFGSQSPTGRLDVPDTQGVYVIKMNDGMVYVGSATKKNTIHRRIHRAFSDSKHAVKSAGYKPSDVRELDWIEMPGGGEKLIYQQEQSLINYYGGIGGGVLLNRVNAPAP
ncbi:polymorphic toxin-type HINT domain-containing protein [Micromonospora echinofusca]|uniref:Hint domain-containing protein n=1 Tax=Micromonospora echinofusca TaxID=47858 RepID=A0ABS3VMT0_MICEH|nr:polymorphic toxin-type HINT domain-containing protein [Micromonospora echinofusca]MBO4205835.1 hypothetical protein [Micromonospora echinofusca]